MLLELFYEIDNFCKAFVRFWQKFLIKQGLAKRIKPCRLCLSEIMTIVVNFHMSGFRTFKDYYIKYVCKSLRQEFPGLVSYTRFVELMSGALVPLITYLQRCRFGKVTGISFIDSTTLRVCNNRRIHQHKTFNSIAQRGKTSMGWFYGFKLHLIVNEKGELLSTMLTPGNIDERAFKGQKLLSKLDQRHRGNSLRIFIYHPHFPVHSRSLVETGESLSWSRHVYICARSFYHSPFNGSVWSVAGTEKTLQARVRQKISAD